MPDQKLTVTAGQPFSQIIRVTNLKNVWATLSLFEVRSQLRKGKHTTDDLIANLHDFMTWAFQGNDLLITWVMTGADTRALYNLSWGSFKQGYFDIVISDVGAIDARALVVPLISLTAVDTITAGAS